MNEYNVQFKVRNNYLLELMRTHGFENAAELSRATGASQMGIGQLLNLKSGVFKYTGGLTRTAELLCDFFNVSPDVLIPLEHMTSPLEDNTREVTMSSMEVQSLVHDGQLSPETVLESDEKREKLDLLLTELTPRERYIITERYGLFGEPRKLIDLAKEFGGTRERIRQIEDKAIRKLKGRLGLREYMLPMTKHLDTLEVLGDS